MKTDEDLAETIFGVERNHRGSEATLALALCLVGWICGECGAYGSAETFGGPGSLNKWPDANKTPTPWVVSSIVISPYLLSALEKVTSPSKCTLWAQSFLRDTDCSPELTISWGIMSFLPSLQLFLRLREPRAGGGGEQEGDDCSETHHKPIKSERLSKDWGLKRENSPFNNNLPPPSPLLKMERKGAEFT